MKVSSLFCPQDFARQFAFRSLGFGRPTFVLLLTSATGSSAIKDQETKNSNRNCPG